MTSPLSRRAVPIGSATSKTLTTQSPTSLAFCASSSARCRSPRSRREPAGEQGEERHRRRECAAVPPGELREPVARRVGARADRAPVAVAPEVGGELGGGLVAARGILAQRGEHDQVEIAAELAAPPLERLRRRLSAAPPRR